MGKWVITRFIKEHNHPLVVTPASNRRSVILSQTPVLQIHYSQDLGSICSKGEHCPKKGYWLWVEFSYPFPLKFDEISILISLALKLLIIELIFIDIDLNHYDSMEINDLPFYEEFDEVAWFSIENWLLEGCPYEIEIYFWWWSYDFEKLIMTWFMILMRKEMRFELKLLMIWIRFGYDLALNLRIWWWFSWWLWWDLNWNSWWIELELAMI